MDPGSTIGGRGPTAHWIGSEMLVNLMIEGRNVNALADSGNQVNTITPAFMQHGMGFLSCHWKT